MVTQNILYVLTVWFFSLLMGLVSWPFAAIFAGELSDKGYTLAKAVGWIVTAYVLLVTATLGLLPLSFISLPIILGSWTMVNLYLLVSSRKQEKSNKVPWREIFLTETIFFIFLSFWSYVKGHQPEIYQIERFMDFGFIQALFNSTHLPLFDIWMSGKNLNYYYFGHLIAYVIISLTHLPIEAGFYLAEAWLFALIGINLYRFGHDVYLYIEDRARRSSAILAGLISLFGVLFAGTWHSTLWFISSLAARFTGIISPSFWYAEPTRIIPGTITEIPIYTFLVADLHAHMWGLLNGILVLLVLFLVWRDKVEINLVRPINYLLGFLLGIAYITNSWDTVTLGALSGAIIAVKYRHQLLRFDFWLLLAEIAAVTIITTLPWSLFFHSPLAGIGIVPKHSPLIPWFLFWGALVVPAVIFVLKVLWRQRQLFAEKIGFMTVIILSAFLLLTLLEIFYFQDILKSGEWFRANTVFKISLQVWLWLALVSGPFLVWFVTSAKQIHVKLFWLLLVSGLLFSQVIYPIKAINQASLERKNFTGLETGLSWWQNKFPSDYDAYLYLKSVRDTLSLADKIRVIVEADGDSYSDTSRFSTFLGWSTISGWAVHEWTWRGSYDQVGARAGEVREIYTGNDLEKANQILRKYKVNYIVIGQVERNKYSQSLNEEKIRELGQEVYHSGNSIVVKI